MNWIYSLRSWILSFTSTSKEGRGEGGREGRGERGREGEREGGKKGEAFLLLIMCVFTQRWSHSRSEK